jgi:hypothetical protein
MVTAHKIASRKKRPKTRIEPAKVFDCYLKEIRLDMFLTLADVSKSGVDMATIARAEGGAEIKLSNAIRLAAFFQRPVEQIWKRKP